MSLNTDDFDRSVRVACADVASTGPLLRSLSALSASSRTCGRTLSERLRRIADRAPCRLPARSAQRPPRTSSPRDKGDPRSARRSSRRETESSRRAGCRRPSGRAGIHVHPTARGDSEDERRDRVRKWYSRDDVRADLRMCLYLLELFGGQRPRLREDVLRHSELADVVQQRRRRTAWVSLADMPSSRATAVA